MSYIVYRKSDTYIITPNRGGKRVFASESAAKSARTKMLNRNNEKGIEDNNDYIVAETGYYKENIEQMITKSYINPHSGKVCEVTLSINTPSSCDPSCETYWCM